MNALLIIIAIASALACLMVFGCFVIFRDAKIDDDGGAERDSESK